jgi:hypothetical protein
MITIEQSGKAPRPTFADMAVAIRTIRGEPADDDLLTIDPVLSPATDTATEEKRPDRFFVDLVPGSNRIVTTVVQDEAGQMRFRIPAYWDDIEAALASDVVAGEI